VSASFSTTLLRQGAMRGAIFLSAAVLAAALVTQNWVIAALVPIAALVILWPVEVSLGMFAFLVPFDSIATIGSQVGGPTLTRVVGAGAGLILLAAGFGQRRLQRPPRAALWWGLFIAWGAITALWAIDPDLAVERLPTAASLFFLYLVTVSIKMSDKEVSRVVLFAIAGALGASILSIHSFLSGAAGLRSTLIGGSEEADPNFLASAFLLPFCLAAGEVIGERNIARKMLMLAAAGVIGLAILFTMSRGALLAVAVMVAVYFWQANKRWRVLVPAFIVGIAVLAMPERFFSRLSGSVADRGAGRLDIWIAGLSALKHYFLQGAGINNFGNAYQLFAGDAPVFRGYNRASHDVYLGTAVELGVLGFTFLMMAFVAQMKSARPATDALANSRLLPYRVACWGLLAAGMFVDLLWSKQFWLAWMLLAVAVRANSSGAPADTTDSEPANLRGEFLETATPYWKLQGLR
jgi:O-antigen ligase